MRKNLFAKFFNIIAIYREILHFTEIPLPFAKFIFAKKFAKYERQFSRFY